MNNYCLCYEQKVQSSVYIVGAFLENSVYIKTMQKYFI